MQSLSFELKANAKSGRDSISLAKIDLDGDHTYGNVIVGAHGMRFDSRDGVRFVIGRYENHDKNRRLQLVICRRFPG